MCMYAGIHSSVQQLSPWVLCVVTKSTLGLYNQGYDNYIPSLLFILHGWKWKPQFRKPYHKHCMGGFITQQAKLALFGLGLRICVREATIKEAYIILQNTAFTTQYNMWNSKRSLLIIRQQAKLALFSDCSVWTWIWLRLAHSTIQCH